MTRGERINRIMIRLEEAVDKRLEKRDVAGDEFVSLTATLARFYALQQTSIQMQRDLATQRGLSGSHHGDPLQ